MKISVLLQVAAKCIAQLNGVELWLYYHPPKETFKFWSLGLFQTFQRLRPEIQDTPRNASSTANANATRFEELHLHRIQP